MERERERGKEDKKGRKGGYDERRVRKGVESEGREEAIKEQRRDEE